MENGSPKKQSFFNLAIAGLLGQVGCVTLIIILVALLGGLWLDTRLNTRPWFVLVFLIASIPISLAVMFAVIRLGLARIKPVIPTARKTKNEEEDIG